MIVEGVGRGSVAGSTLAKSGLALLFCSIPFSLSIMQIGLGLAIVGAVIDLSQGRVAARTPLDLPLLLFVGLTVLSAVFSGDVGKGLHQAVGSWTIAGMYLMTLYGSDRPFMRKLVSLLLFSATITACYALFQHLTGIDFLRQGTPLSVLEFAEKEVFLPRGAFSHYQTFANVFLLIFCLSLGLAMVNGRGMGRLLSMIVSIVLGAAILFTFTRGIWLAALGVILFVTALSGRRSALMGLAATTVVLALSSPVFVARGQSIIQTEKNVERFLLWETTWNMIRENPGLGVGVGSYQRVQEDFLRDEIPVEMTRTHAHNNFLQVTVERGLFGLFLFLWIWYVIVKEGFTVLRGLRGERTFRHALVVGSVAGQLGFFLDGFFQNNFGDTEVAIPFWLLTGIVMNEVREFKKDGSDS
jgi:O-antigen ligase